MDTGAKRHVGEIGSHEADCSSTWSLPLTGAVVIIAERQVAGGAVLRFVSVQDMHKPHVDHLLIKALGHSVE